MAVLNRRLYWLTAIDNPSPFWPWTVSASHNPWPSFAPMMDFWQGFFGPETGLTAIQACPSCTKICQRGSRIKLGRPIGLWFGKFLCWLFGPWISSTDSRPFNTVLAVAYSQTAVAVNQLMELAIAFKTYLAFCRTRPLGWPSTG